MRDDRLLKAEVTAYSEKLAWEDSGGRGEREREVERELCPDCVGRAGIWIVRESLREEAPPEAHEVDAGGS